MGVIRLPESRTRRAAICLGLAALWPFLPAMLTFCGLILILRLSPGTLTWGQFQAVNVTGMILAAAGSAAAMLALPIRYWSRIAAAVACFLITGVGFTLWCAGIEVVAERAFGLALPS